MKLIGQILFPLIILALAILGFKALKGSKPPLESKRPPVSVPEVSVAVVEPQDVALPLETFGTVQSYFDTTLIPQISGEVLEITELFQVGSRVKKGEVLVRIDDIDYQAIYATATANVMSAKLALAEEEIRVQQASQDWVASGRSLSKASDFVLRKPQLASAKANITSAEAEQAKAMGDMESTVIRAPYDAVVTARTVSVGDLATSQTSLGALVATGKAEIRLPFTAAQLQSVKLPEKGEEAPVATLTSASLPGVTWSAKIVRSEPTIDAKNQVSYVIAEIDEPYDQETPLPIGTFVNASITAGEIKGVYQLPESALVNDSYVWAVDAESKLLKLSASRAHSADGEVFLNIERGELEPPLSILTRPLTILKEADEVKAQ